jgi:hypothetical protein
MSLCNYRYWAKACTLLTCILGLTWLFGVFYINNETIFMAYFFTIFNSLQVRTILLKCIKNTFTIIIDIFECLMVFTWRHRRHVGVPWTKDFLLASIVRDTNMAAMSLSFYSFRNEWKPRIENIIKILSPCYWNVQRIEEVYLFST